MAEVATARDALGARLLGDQVKKAGERAVQGGANEIADFVKALLQTKAAIRNMSWDDVVSGVRTFDAPSRRPSVFPELSWTRETVPLDHCWVWPLLGHDPAEGIDRTWAVGSVPMVANSCRGQVSDPLQGMASRWQEIPFSEMPLVVVRVEGRADRFRIDDGNHRAVAAWMAGDVRAQAFVGVIHRVNEMWDWSVE